MAHRNLDQSILIEEFGLQRLWEQTLGTPEVCIAVLDGPVDLDHPTFQGARLEQLGFGNPISVNDPAIRHGTHVSSIIFGQHQEPLRGIAPECSGVIIPVFQSSSEGEMAPCSQVELARAIIMAVEYGAKVINVSGGEYSPSATAHPILSDAVKMCVREGVLIVAAAGNDGCSCVHVPGALPSVLVVGACDINGEPLGFSNWGDVYSSTGILAPGDGILGAIPGNRYAIQTGTSFASPIVAGVAGLLLSLRLAQQGKSVMEDADIVRSAILQSAQREDCHHPKECQRLLAGKLNINGTMNLIFEKRGIEMEMSENTKTQTRAVKPAQDSVSPVAQTEGPSPVESHESRDPNCDTHGNHDLPEMESNGISASECGCKSGAAGERKRPQFVFALGKIGYDFSTEARRDTVVANMEVPNVAEQGNPHDPRQMVSYLERNQPEAARITWTLSHDSTPIYAIEPHGAFAANAYSILTGFLRDQLAEGVEVVSIAGTIIGTTRLSTGQTIPVVLPEIRGMFSWTIGKLVEGVIGERLEKEEVPSENVEELRGNLENFLRRIYFEFRNLGLASEHRAINFAGTQIFHIARYLERQQRRGYHLDAVEVHRSPICRPESDCWDVRIIFFDPENVLRARSAFLVTIDVSDSVPVMISDGVREFSIR